MRFAERTVDVYTSLLNRFIAHIGDREGTFTLEEVTGYYVSLKRRQAHGATLQLATVTIRTFAKYLFLTQKLHWNYELIPIHFYSADIQPIISQEDARRMIDQVPVSSFKDLRDKTMLSFLYATGVRINELCCLRAKDVSTRKNWTVVRSAKKRGRSKNKFRRIFWDEQTSDLLKEYLTQLPRYSKNDTLWPALDKAHLGLPLTTRTVERIYDRWTTDERTSCHSLRRLYITDGASSGVQLVPLATLVGHDNIGTTAGYVHLYGKDLEKAYAQFRGTDTLKTT